MRPIQALVRTRKQLFQERARHTLRIQETLNDANINLKSVIADIMSVGGRQMIESLMAGQTDPAKLSRFADPRLNPTQETLREALGGRLTGHHRFLLRVHLGQIDVLDAAIDKLDNELEAGGSRNTR
jgi:hypothetical protein